MTNAQVVCEAEIGDLSITFVWYTSYLASASYLLKHSDKIEACVPIKGQCLIKTQSFWPLKQINCQAFIRCYRRKRKRRGGERRKTRPVKPQRAIWRKNTSKNIHIQHQSDSLLSRPKSPLCLHAVNMLSPSLQLCSCFFLCSQSAQESVVVGLKWKPVVKKKGKLCFLCKWGRRLGGSLQ